MVPSGNGWVRCRCGHRHWGLFGAAGLLVTNGSGDDAHVLLAHRSAWTHQGGAWAVPGGAADAGETPLQAALRETREETTLDVTALTPYGEWVDDHGDWRYTTVLARAPGRLDAAPAQQPGDPGRSWQENDEVRWWPAADVADLHLHPGFAAAWPHLRELVGGTLP